MAFKPGMLPVSVEAMEPLPQAASDKYTGFTSNTITLASSLGLRFSPQVAEC